MPRIYGRQAKQMILEKLEREMARLKVLAEQIGAIDPLIVEEYDETQKRYDFLTGQSLDLEKAIGLSRGNHQRNGRKNKNLF